MFGTYIHIPFCDKLCTYCDFAKEIAKPEKKRAYLKALFYEMQLSEALLKTTDTVYIGGGTPTALDDEDFETLLKTIHTYVPVADLKEFTIEANPMSLTQEKARLMKAYGVTRVSLGVQTFNDALLTLINRDHRHKDVIQALQILDATGLNHYSLDIMFGLPTQTMESFKKDLERFIAVKAAHYSIYALILEDNTRLKHQIKQGLLQLPDDDTVADMYGHIIQRMQEEGYDHYEISSFARPGMRSVHNPIYWRNEAYLGLGAGAHGRLGDTRYENIRSVKKYTEAMLEKGLDARLPYPYEPIHDTLLMGLRMKEGISVQSFIQRFGVHPLTRFKGLNDRLEEGLITIENDRLQLTDKGLFFANNVWMDCLDDEDAPQRI